MDTLFTTEDLDRVLAHPQTGIGAGIGLYRGGYRSHGMDFWGLKPGSEIVRFLNSVPHAPWNQCSVLELGAGTGKNILEFVRHDVARAVAVEIDSLAITQLLNTLIQLEEAGLVPEGKLALVKDDALNFLAHSSERFNIVVCYGLLHVFKEEARLKEAIHRIAEAVSNNGYLILQSLTNKHPAPPSQPELTGIKVAPKLIRESFGSNVWKLWHWDENDITHSHVGSEDNHCHGSVRAIFKRLNPSQ